MNKNILWTLIVVAVVLVLTALFVYLKSDEGRSSGDNEVAFVSPDSNDSVAVVFKEGGQAVLTGLGYDGLVLDQAIAASGARYVDEETGVELWNRGNDVTISRGGQQIFSGNVGGLSDAEKLSGTWEWQATTIGGVVIEPQKADTFTITFDLQEKRVNGTTDCNGFFGGYAAEGNTLTLGPLASTMMYCEGSQEQEFTAPFEDVKSFFFAGSGALVLELEDGGTMLFGKQ